MDKIVYSGDLYIKYAPTIITKHTPKNGEKLFEVSAKDLDKDSITDALLLFADKVDEILASEDYKTKVIEDYKNNEGFYSLSFADDMIIFTSEDKTMDAMLYDDEEGMHMRKINVFYDYESFDVANKYFISLKEFLVKASYVGFYLESGKDVIQVLYEYLDTYFIINSDGEFSVISKHHPSLKNYTKGASIQDNFDKKSIYLAIVKERLINGNGYTR